MSKQLDTIPTADASSETEKLEDEDKRIDKDASLSQTLHHAADIVADKLHIHNFQAGGISKRFNPTSVHFHVYTRDEGKAEDEHRELKIMWRSRDNRKGRNSVSIPISPNLSTGNGKAGGQIKTFFSHIWAMFATFPYWDMAFWSGWSYSWGSVLFVIDGAFSWGPLAFPNTEHPSVTKWGVPLCFFFGACFYQIGATMAYLEAINDGSFAGSAMRRLLEGHEEQQKVLLDNKLRHFFSLPDVFKTKQGDSDEEAPANQWEKVRSHKRQNSTFPGQRRGGLDLGEAKEGEISEYMTWQWWPTWRALRHHHLHEIGYIACAIQLFGATMYGVTSIVVLPGILDSLAWWQELAAYWVIQCVASGCFLTASILFTLETQSKWYKPCPGTVGWWIGIWAAIGSIGFLLSAILGCLSNDHTWAEYQSSLSSMWGSAAYLLSSLLQWWEATNKGPVLAFPNSPDRLMPKVQKPVRRAHSISESDGSNITDDSSAKR